MPGEPKDNTEDEICTSCGTSNIEETEQLG